MIAWMTAPAGLNIVTSLVIAAVTILVTAQSLMPPMTMSHSDPIAATISFHAAAGPSVTRVLTKANDLLEHRDRLLADAP